MSETYLELQSLSFFFQKRHGINEIITTSILEHLNIITQRTFKTKVIFNNSKINVYYFQEKISKELIEHNQLREGPLVLGSEEYYWEKRNKLDNNSLLVFAEIANKYWSRRSAVNEKISFKALGEYNKYIFNSLDSNNLWINSKLTYDIADPRNYEIAKFDIALISLDAQHGLALTNRILYYDNIADLFLLFTMMVILRLQTVGSLIGQILIIYVMYLNSMKMYDSIVTDTFALTTISL